MKSIRRILIFLLCIALCITGCSAAAVSSPDTSEKVQVPTLRFLLRNTASGMDRILDALNDQMDDEHRWKLEFTFVDTVDYSQQLSRSLTAHDSYDFVFDAQWISLTTQVEQGSYKNLKNYFNNPAYPALQAVFSQQYLEANTINGGNYAIPFTSTYYDIPGIFYRKDLLQQLNLPFTEITSREQMEQYWSAVQQQGRITPLTLGSRGFYQYNIPEISLCQVGIWNIPGWSFWDYPALVILSADGKTVQDVVFLGDDAARFAALNPSYETNLLDDYLLGNAVSSRWLAADDLLQENGTFAFLQGQSASYEGTLNSGSGLIQQNLRTLVPEAEVGFWPYDGAFQAQNRTVGSIPTTYAAWNYLCVPSYCTNTEEAMRFLDWLYSDWSRIDLFNYGVEGVDWQAVGEDEYRLLQPKEEPFSFPSYELAWNPEHHRMDASLPDNEKALLEFIFAPDSYTASPLSGFTLNTKSISIERSGLNSLYDEYYIAFGHGAYGDATQEKIAEFHARSEAIGLETVRAEIHRQIQQHLDQNNAG